MRTKIIKSIKLWLVLMTFLVLAIAKVEAQSSDPLSGPLLVPLDNFNFNDFKGGNPNGSFVASGSSGTFYVADGGGVTKYTPNPNGMGEYNSEELSDLPVNLQPISIVYDQASGKLAGTTSSGGANGAGNIWDADDDGSDYENPYDFFTLDGDDPQMAALS